ncbi:mitochondrial mRNA pseudouridine synthase Rpusd3 [Andrena cerasifolii]|uniref:mitochondrial mRNA pseudouridine synthase Rpusd3 n=1 Tax=Andrena cerasifolii TaxID=2819439 RepID=UPI0040382583
MQILTMKFGVVTRTCASAITSLCTTKLKRAYAESVALKNSGKERHPFKDMHPWKSITEFSTALVNNVIYNQDGLVVINKPYGIGEARTVVHKQLHHIPNAVDYALQDALPHIAAQLKYSELTVVRKPEKYMTGVTLLAADPKVEKAVETALHRGNNFTKTYWVITTRVPRTLKGKEQLAMKLVSSNCYKYRTPVIATSWYNNAIKRGEMKILNVEFNVLSNSTLNLCSLVQIRSSTQKWHALRLFASTFLYSPILGDNLYASRIQKVGQAYVQVDPFQESTKLPAKLDKQIIDLLNVRSVQQHIIPVHIHLRSVALPSFLGKGKDLIVEAPLIPPFDWTCKQLEFKCLM